VRTVRENQTRVIYFGAKFNDKQFTKVKLYTILRDSFFFFFSHRLFCVFVVRRIRIFGRGHLSPIIPPIVATELLISQTMTIAMGEDLDRGEDEETREEVNLKNRHEYVYWSAEEKLLVPLAPLHKRELREERKIGDVRRDVRQRRRRLLSHVELSFSLSLILKAAFVSSLDASLYFCFLKLESGFL